MNAQAEHLVGRKNEAKKRIPAPFLWGMGWGQELSTDTPSGPGIHAEVSGGPEDCCQKRLSRKGTFELGFVG